MLADDVRFTMPPLPAWFDGREMVLRFIAERMFATPWRLRPATINGQPGFACEQQVDGALAARLGHRPGSPRRADRTISGFVDPALVEEFLRDR